MYVCKLPRGSWELKLSLLGQLCSIFPALKTEGLMHLEFTKLWSMTFNF